MNNPNISRLVLLKTSLENDYKHTLWFGKPDVEGTKTNQTNYFLGRKLGSQYDYTNLTYIRKDHSIKVPANYDEIVGCNYVMYQNNPNYNANNLNQDKWYYAFVTDIRYINEGVTELILETDVIQTWYFAYTVQPSFIEREHVNDDTPGKNTYPEQVELGEFVTNKRINSQMIGASNNIIVASTIDLSEYKTGVTSSSYPNLTGTTVGGVYSGVRYYEFPNAESLNLCLTNVSKAGRSDGIISIFIGDSNFYEAKDVDGKAYREIVDNEESYQYEKEFNYVIIENGAYVQVTPPEKPTTVNGYTPRNKKLLTFPYCYLYASNNAGGGGIYHYEKFSGDKSDFKFYGNVAPGMSIRMLPLNYDNQAINNEEGINCGKLPICSWNTDVYTNWLTQNSVNIGIDLVSGVVNTGVGLASMGVPGGALMGGSMALGSITQIASTLGQVHQMSFTPPQAKGNLNSGDITFSSGWSRVSLYDKSIKQEYAKIIDGYFDMFGYKVCRVKRPNTNHRSRYWYIKTIDVNIDGNIPGVDIQKIKDAYNNGITFWRNGNEIGNYDLSNGIVNLD